MAGKNLLYAILAQFVMASALLSLSTTPRWILRCGFHPEPFSSSPLPGWWGGEGSYDCILFVMPFPLSLPAHCAAACSHVISVKHSQEMTLSSEVTPRAWISAAAFSKNSYRESDRTEVSVILHKDQSLWDKLVLEPLPSVTNCGSLCSKISPSGFTFPWDFYFK